MCVTYTVLWSAVILQVISVLSTAALSDDNNTKSENILAFNVLPVSPTAVNVQWMNCIGLDSVTLKWEATVENALEKWNRADMKILDLCQKSSDPGQQVDTIITDLEEGMNYKISMLTSGEFHVSMHLNTLTSAPSGPPIYLNGYSVNSATMHITWTRPKLLDCNGDIMAYIIMVESDLDEHTYRFEVASDCVSTKCTKIQCFSHNFTVPEDELVPYRNYSVKIAAVNINGTGPFSNAITVMSGENEPGPPENLRVVVVTSDSEENEFMLQWDMPRNPNGVILEYKIEYGIENDTITSNFTDSMNYSLNLSSNETYIIAVYAKNSAGIGSAAEIQWPTPDDSSSSDNKEHKNYTYVIIGSCVGAFGLALTVCIVMCIRFRHKKSSSHPSRSKSNKFYPADSGHFGTLTVVNQGYVYAERGSNSLPYDYPYMDVNGAQASSAITFQPKRSRKSTNNSSATNTLGYIEIPAQANNCSKPHPKTPNSPNKSSEQLSIEQSSIVSPSLPDYVNQVPRSENNERALLSPGLGGAKVNTKTNTTSDNGYVTLRS